MIFIVRRFLSGRRPSRGGSALGVIIAESTGTGNPLEKFSAPAGGLRKKLLLLRALTCSIFRRFSFISLLLFEFPEESPCPTAPICEKFFLLQVENSQELCYTERI